MVGQQERRTHTTKRLLAISGVALALAACNGSASGGSALKPAASPSGSASTGASPSATPSATTSPTPSPTPLAPPTQPVVAPRSAPVAMRTFALVPFGMGSASGSVTVTLQGQGFSVFVSARGMRSGSWHAVHLHAGSCGSALSSTHLLILGTLVANASGAGSVGAHVGFPYSTDRFVIVYANLSPNTIIGCADLGSV